jgi:hypothetical protein
MEVTNGEDVDVYEGLIAHRIVYIYDERESENLQKKGYALIVQGDIVYSNESLSDYKYNPAWGLETDINLHPKKEALKYYDIVSTTHVLALYNGAKWNKAGNLLDMIQGNNKDFPTGFLLVIVLPTFLLLIVQLFFLFTDISKIRNKKNADENKAVLLEEEKEKIRKEVLEELKREQDKKE